MRLPAYIADGGGHGLRALLETGSAAAAIATAATSQTASQTAPAAEGGWEWLEGKEALFLGLSIGLLAIILVAFSACYRCARVQPAPEPEPSPALAEQAAASAKGQEGPVEWPVVVVEPDRTLSVGYEVKLGCSDDEDEQEAPAPSTAPPTAAAASPAPGTATAASSSSSGGSSSSQARGATSQCRRGWLPSMLGWR